MADNSGLPDSEDVPSSNQRPIGIIAAVATFLLLAVFGYWISREKQNDKAREQVLSAMDQQLSADEEALKAQRELLAGISHQVEEMRVGIEMGRYPDGKAAVAKYNKLAAQQRAERAKFTTMAEEYNKKVAEFRKLEQ